jgi:hypothetical protein
MRYYNADRMRLTQLALVLSALAAAACSGPPLSPVEQLLADVEAKVEDKDADGLGKLLAPEFTGPGGLKRAGVPAELRRYFFMYDSLDVTFSGPLVEGAPPASVKVRVDLSGKPKDVGGLAGLVPDLAAYDLELGLRAEGERLLITRAAYARIDVAAEP